MYGIFGYPISRDKVLYGACDHFTLKGACDHFTLKLWAR
jgi:hypothetical protein